MLHTISINSWQPQLAPASAQEIITHLESGKVIHLPNLNFDLETDEQNLLHSGLEPVKAKSIGYYPETAQLAGVQDQGCAPVLCKMMARYHQKTLQLLNALRPEYQLAQHTGRTSYRPVEIKDRPVGGYRQDDRLLHVDAFRGTPTNDKRILRIFTNINPFNEPRVWQLGEPYLEVVKKFLPGIRPMYPLEAEFLAFFRSTDKKRWRYDHNMLYIHNHMKADNDYQAQVAKTDVNFQPFSTWIVYTDLVSHAALAGRFALEQTFYPPVHSMQNPEYSPQHQMRKA